MERGAAARTNDLRPTIYVPAVSIFRLGVKQAGQNRILISDMAIFLLVAVRQPLQCKVSYVVAKFRHNFVGEVPQRYPPLHPAKTRTECLCASLLAFRLCLRLCTSHTIDSLVYDTHGDPVY